MSRTVTRVHIRGLAAKRAARPDALRVALPAALTEGARP